MAATPELSSSFTIPFGALVSGVSDSLDLPSSDISQAMVSNDPAPSTRSSIKSSSVKQSKSKLLETEVSSLRSSLSRAVTQKNEYFRLYQEASAELIQLRTLVLKDASSRLNLASRLRSVLSSIDIAVPQFDTSSLIGDD